MNLIIAADTGGTFTDLAAFDLDTGVLASTKALTTYEDLVNGVMNCLAKARVDLTRAEVVKFATTLVINTFVQRNGARTALITTDGHRDILEIRRGNRAHPFDFRYKRDPVLVERDLRFEVAERIGGDGAVVRPLDLAQLRDIATRLRELKIEAVAIAFLNSYANSTHEEQAAKLLRENLPGVYIVASTELTREWYEYERTSTAAANAYVGPRLIDFISRLDHRLRDEGFKQNFYMMASNGGVFSLPRARREPGALLESGPVGGCIGAGVYAKELGIPRLVAFDMGGTTAKCAVLEDGRFEVRSPYYVGGEEFGFPVRHAVLDIAEVGAGGGSIAYIDAQGRLNVGPKSAGSEPGPVCYARGGKEPTITDANLVLGRIAASAFLGGEMKLDEPAARAAIAGKLAEPLGFKGDAGLDETAQGIISLGTMTMASAIKQITTERGLDPRDFALFAFGGGGPLHAQTLAREMSIPTVIIPPEPGIFSAVGMVLADARVDEVRTFLRPLVAQTMPALRDAFDEMEQAIRGPLAEELGTQDLALLRQLQMRFTGQRHFIKTPLDPGFDVAAIRAAFEAEYRQRYGHVETGAPIEIVGLLVTATAQLRRPTLTQMYRAPDSAAPSTGTRPVYFAERGARLAATVYQRSNLAPGFAASGPAVIEEYGSTTIVGPDDRFEVGKLGEIWIHLGG